jgi:hypothetical protein
VERDFVVGVEIVLGPRARAQLVDLAEVPPKHLAETTPELRQRFPRERREAARHDHAVPPDQLLEESRVKIIDLLTLERRADDDAERFERFERPPVPRLFSHGRSF